MITVIDENSISFNNGINGIITGTSNGLITLSSNSGNVRISGIADPINNQDASTKNYVDTRFSISGSSGQIFYNNNGTIAGSNGLSTNGTTTLSSLNKLILQDNIELHLGTSSIGKIFYDSASTTCKFTVSSGNLNIANSGNINISTPVTNFVNITNGLTSKNSYGLVSGNSSQTIPHATFTKLSTYWNGSPSIIGDASSTRPTFSSGSYNINKAGKYLFTATAPINLNSTGVRSMFFGKNITAPAVPTVSVLYGHKSSNTITTDRTSMSISYIFDLIINDKIEVFVFQTSGGNLGMNTVVSGHFIVQRIG